MVYQDDNVVIAEDEDEAIWIEVRDKAKEYAESVIPEQMKQLEKELKINNALLELAESKIKYENKEHKDE
jgi:predicted metal-dependent hydrolase